MSDAPFKLLFPETWPRTALAAVLIALTAFVAYHGAFSTPFIFGDLPGIVRNPTIRQLWPLIDVLLPAQTTNANAVGLPVVNLSFALNYAAGGLDVRGYHLFNMLLHIAGGVLLFALTYRVLRSPRLQARFEVTAFPLALGIALVWTLHPLQTASVTCVSHRAESLATFFLLLTLYAFARATDGSEFRRRWAIVAVIACTLGMATKEVMVVAPLLVLLFDRTFMAGTFAEAWRQRGGVHLALAATWLLLAFLMMRDGGRGSVTELGVGLRGGDFLLTQGRDLALALKLAVWPAPLVLDYGPAIGRGLRELWPQAFLLFVSTTATVFTLVRRPMLGFFGAWFFLTLVFSGGLEPLATPTFAEHRVYLPLAAVVMLGAGGLVMFGGRRGAFALFGVAVVCGGATICRNADYESALTIWSDTVQKASANPRAHYHLANALSAAGRGADAISHYETALRLQPGYAAAHHNLAGALLQQGRAEAAVPHYEAVLCLEPNSAEAHVNLAAALIRLGRGAEAVTHYEAAARSGLLAAEEQLRFGRALAEIGRFDDALVRLRAAQRLAPRSAETRVVIGMVLSAAGRGAEALSHFTDAVVLDPSDANARTALGDALIEADRPAEALSHYETALRLQPAQAAMLHTGMGNALIRLSRVADAITHYEEALRLNPDDVEARRNLATVRAAVQRRGPGKN